MGQRGPYYPPESFVDDIDTSIEVNAGDEDALLLPQMDAAAEAMRQDFRGIVKDTRGRRFVVAEILEAMKDVHIVIRKIYAEFPGSPQLCAFPLARQEIETLFILIGLLRIGDSFLAGWEKASLANAYKYFLYEKEETRELTRFQADSADRMALFHNKMKGMQSPFTDEQIKSIEGFVLHGEKLQGIPRSPSLKGIIRELGSDSANVPLAKVLFRLYIEYEWLCAYTHCDLWAQSTRRFFSSLESDIDLERLMNNVTRQPVVELSYLVILMALTEISSHVTDPLALRTALCRLWEPFEKGSFLGKFIWLRWAREAMGLLDG